MAFLVQARGVVIRSLVAAAIAVTAGLAVTGCADRSAGSGRSGQSGSFGAPVEFLGTYPTPIGTYDYVKVPRRMSGGQVISLARKLHAFRPKDTFWLLDDKTKVRQLMAALPKTAKGDYSTFPRQWFDQHLVASIELVLGTGHPYWVVLKGTSQDVTNPMAKLS